MKVVAKNWVCHECPDGWIWPQNVLRCKVCKAYQRNIRDIRKDKDKKERSHARKKKQYQLWEKLVEVYKEDTTVSNAEIGRRCGTSKELVRYVLIKVGVYIPKSNYGKS